MGDVVVPVALSALIVGTVFALGYVMGRYR